MLCGTSFLSTSGLVIYGTLLAQALSRVEGDVSITNLKNLGVEGLLDNSWKLGHAKRRSDVVCDDVAQLFLTPLLSSNYAECIGQTPFFHLYYCMQKS